MFEHGNFSVMHCKSSQCNQAFKANLMAEKLMNLYNILMRVFLHIIVLLVILQELWIYTKRRVPVMNFRISLQVCNQSHPLHRKLQAYIHLVSTTQHLSSLYHTAPITIPLYVWEQMVSPWQSLQKGCLYWWRQWINNLFHLLRFNFSLTPFKKILLNLYSLRENLNFHSIILINLIPWNTFTKFSLTEDMK